MSAIYFENYDSRIDQITAFLAKNGISGLEEVKALCDAHGIDIFGIVRGIQPICFDDACWAYSTGAAVAIKKQISDPKEIALTLGAGLQTFCLKGSISDERQIGIGHGKLASMILSETIKCFAFLAGHESFAAAEGAIGIVRSANKVRKTPLKVILNGLGKDAAQIISRVNSFTYVKTFFDFYTGQLIIAEEIPYSRGEPVSYTHLRRRRCNLLDRKLDRP